MIDDKLRTAARATLTEYLKAKRLRKTPERYAILDKVCEMNKHFDIEALYAAIEGDGYHVSRATIYNTMELLSDCGIVRRHQFGAQPAQYERVSATVNHLHRYASSVAKSRKSRIPSLCRS